jgi:hypothetical protein
MFGQEFHRTGKSSTLAPVIDIDRTWHTGRENENFGEDPFLTGSMVAPEVRAIQAQGVMTTVKHCCAYTQEQGRAGQDLSLTSTPIANTGENELISERALEEIYGPAWQAAVSADQGNAMSVMCGYAIVNGSASPPYSGADSCGNKFILNDLIKGQYGFEGTFTPDAVTAERDAAVLNFENGGDGGDIRLTVAQLQAIVGDGSGNGQTNADGSQEHHLPGAARRRGAPALIGQNDASPTRPTTRASTPESPRTRSPRPRSRSRAPSCSATSPASCRLTRTTSRSPSSVRRPVPTATPRSALSRPNSHRWTTTDPRSSIPPTCSPTP